MRWKGRARTRSPVEKADLVARLRTDLEPAKTDGLDPEKLYGWRWRSSRAWRRTPCSFGLMAQDVSDPALLVSRAPRCRPETRSLRANLRRGAPAEDYV